MARARAGADGEPELLLHDDLRGYSWNVPKTDWLNVGSGTVDPGEVRAAWQQARARFLAAGHVPTDATPELEPKAMKGYAYYLFDPAHLDGAAAIDGDGRGGRLLVGDSLGLAQPLTAEGILPAVVSGRVCAEAILAGEPARYPARLAAHPLIGEYRRVFRLRQAAAAWRAKPVDRARPTASPPLPRRRGSIAWGGARWPRDSRGCSRAPACPRRPSSISRCAAPNAGSAAGPPRRRHYEGRSMNAIAQSLRGAFDERSAGGDHARRSGPRRHHRWGATPWDVRIDDPRVYQRALRDGSLAWARATPRAGGTATPSTR